MAGYRPAYTVEEKKGIVKYIIDNDAYKRVKGRGMWVEMANSGLFRRTHDSLKEHFLKRIIFDLHLSMFQLTQEQIDMFREGAKPNEARQLRARAGLPPRQPAVPHPNYELQADMWDSTDED